MMRAILMALMLSAGPLFIGVGHAQTGDMAKYCKADIERLCKDVAPGGGRVLQCLKAHGKEMSVGCAQALQKLKG